MGKRDRTGSEKKPRKKAKKEGTYDESEVSTTSDKSSKKSAGGPESDIDPATGRLCVFYKKKVELSISLYPGSLQNCKESVSNALRDMLMKYSEGLGGILLSFENVELKGTGSGDGRGWILNEHPFVHYDVSCNALIFSPKVGCKLRGVVNECFPSHVGILVFNYFNAMISADQLRASGFSFDPDLQNWIVEGKSRTISVKDEMDFVIEKVHEADGTVSLEGVEPSMSLLVDN